MVQISFQQIGGGQVQSSVPDDATIEQLYQAAYDFLGRNASDREAHPIKLVLKGATVPHQQPNKRLGIATGGTDVLLIVPQRKAPPEHLLAAVAQARGGRSSAVAGEEDDDEASALPLNAAAWEFRVVAALRARRCPDWLLECVIFLRPKRLAWFLVYLVVWIILAKLNLAPVFTLLTIVAVIFTNLGKRRAGEASAYSVFNNGVRLPGQLDADEIDRQVREGRGLR